MGRHCGWLTAQTARDYRSRLAQRQFLPELLVSKDRWDVDAIFVPEQSMDLDAEVERLKKVMDEKDGVNIFLSEGAGQDAIVKEMEASGQEVPRDAFGHVRLDEINPGQWFAKQFSKKLKAEKTLVQKVVILQDPQKQMTEILNLSRGRRFMEQIRLLKERVDSQDWMMTRTENWI